MGRIATVWIAADAGRVGPYLGPERGATSSSVILQFGLASNRIQAMLAACIQFVLWCLHAGGACVPAWRRPHPRRHAAYRLCGGLLSSETDQVVLICFWAAKP